MGRSMAPAVSHFSSQEQRIPTVLMSAGVNCQGPNGRWNNFVVGDVPICCGLWYGLDVVMNNNSGFLQLDGNINE